MVREALSSGLVEFKYAQILSRPSFKALSLSLKYPAWHGQSSLGVISLTKVCSPALRENRARLLSTYKDPLLNTKLRKQTQTVI